MPRQARLDAPGTLHHVMIRGIERSDLFRDERDRGEFLSRISELAGATNTRILAWAMMGSHVHLVLLSGDQGLPRFMRRLLTGYAIWFNRRHQRVGHLFQNRYKSIVCEEDPYLLELVRYVHMNPLRGGVVKSLEELEKYPWSGHGVVVGKLRNQWQEREYVLKQFGREEKEAIRAYRKFMREGEGLGRRSELVGGALVGRMGGWSRVFSPRGRGEGVAHDSRILGSGDFVQAVIREAEESVARQMRSRRKERSIERVIKEMCKEAGVKEQEVCGGIRGRRISEERGRIAYCLNREIGLSMAETARRLGVGTSAIGMAIKRRDSRDGNR